MEGFYFIPSQPTDTEEEERLLSRRYLPSSAQDRSANPVQISDTPVTSSVSLPTGSNTTFSVTTTNDYKHRILVSHEWSVFVGSTADPAANLLPGGSSITHGSWLMHGPITSQYNISTGVASQQYETRSRVNIVNNSGSTHTITITVRAVLIENEGRSL